MSKARIDDARLEEIVSRMEVAAAELSECGFDPQFDLDTAAALRELQQLRETIKRYKKALQWYADDAQYPVELNTNKECEAWQSIARNALWPPASM